jgi:uncharacterized protein (UPF0335 family)
MEKNFKENMRNVLETAMKNWDEKKFDTNFHRNIVQNALKNGKITEKQANELLKKIDNLEKLKQDLWNDDKLTKQEFEKLQQEKNLLRQDMKQIFQKNMRHKKNHNCPDPNCRRQGKNNPMEPEME